MGQDYCSKPSKQFHLDLGKTRENHIQRCVLPNFYVTTIISEESEGPQISRDRTHSPSHTHFFFYSSRFHFKQGDNYSKPHIRSSVHSCGGGKQSKFRSFLSLPHEESDGKKQAGDAEMLAKCQGEVLSVCNMYLPFANKAREPGYLTFEETHIVCSSGKDVQTIWGKYSTNHLRLFS